MLLSPRLPATNERGPLYTEQALSALHQGNVRRERLTLLFASHAGAAGLFIRCTSRLRPLVDGPLLAQYPDLAIESLSENVLGPPPGTVLFTRHLYLTPYLFPIRRYVQFTDDVSRTLADPVSAILGAVQCRADDNLSAQVELEVAPAPPKTVRRARKILRRLMRPFFERHPRFERWYAEWSLSCPGRSPRQPDQRVVWQVGDSK